MLFGPLAKVIQRLSFENLTPIRNLNSMPEVRVVENDCIIMLIVTVLAGIF